MTKREKPGSTPKEYLSKKHESLYMLFDTYCEAHSTSNISLIESLQEMPLDELIRKHKKVAYDFLGSDISQKKKQIWINKIYSDCNLTDYEPLLNLLTEDSKLIRRYIERVISTKEKKTRESIEQKFPKLSEEAQNWAKQLFRFWDNTHAKAKIKFKNKKEIIDYCSKHIELYRTMQIAWLPLKPYTMIPWSDSSDFVPRPVVRYILSEYMAFPQAIRLKDCDSIVPFFNQPEWYASLEQLLQFWLDDGAEANRKGILAPYCFYGSEQQLERLHTLLKSWLKKGRKGLVSYTLGLLGLKATPPALRILDEWIELMPEGKYRREALKAFQQVAIHRGLTIDELADRLIPTFGLNRLGEKEIDYGHRILRLTLLPDFSISVFDATKQKTSKSLPAPLKHDDKEKAEKAKEEMAGLKKQVKTQTTVQRRRLEQVLKNGRTWPAETWQTIFVENPIFRYITNGLIWGIYKEGRLQESFRYLEDGSLITADQKEFILPANAVVSLVHPVELDDHLTSQWEKQLHDNRIEPLLPQLATPVHRLSDSEKQGNEISRYAGRTVRLSSIYEFESRDLISRIEEQTLYIIDKSLDIAARLPFEYEENTCTIKELSFSPYKEGADPDTIELPEDERIPISSIPERFISSLLDVLVKVFVL